MLAVRFAEISPDRIIQRQTWLVQHQLHLRSGAIRIVQSGPLSDEGGIPGGGLLIAEVDDLDELRRFSDADPFVVHRIYARVRILRWNRTIG